MKKRSAQRLARLLAGQAEKLFQVLEASGAGLNMTRDDVIEHLQSMLMNTLETSEKIVEAMEHKRELEVRSAKMRIYLEWYNAEKAHKESFGQLEAALEGMRVSLQRPRPSPVDVQGEGDEVTSQLEALTLLVQQALNGGADRPFILEEVERWAALRAGHAQEKKIKTDINRVLDFVEYAGNRPVNRYKFSDIQAFTNVLARSPANMTKGPKLAGMTREQAADYNDGLPVLHRLPTLTSKAIEANYLSPLRMFFRAMAADYDFRSPLADLSPVVPASARDSVQRVPFSVDELNVWFRAAATEKRPDLKWLPLLATLTGARIGELIFLQGKDIYRIRQNLWVADLTTDLVLENETVERRIKNKSSRRLFALHSVLEATDFYEYVQKRQGETWLFPHAFKRGKEKVNDPADAASKRLNARLVKLGIHRAYETTFHSSRHTAKDIMRIAGVDPRTADRQTGHAMKSVADSYGRKTLLDEEVEVLSALSLPDGLDVSPYFVQRHE